MINLRWNRLPAALLAAGLLLTTSLRADSAYMVTVTDIDKDTTTYEVLDRAGLSALKEKIKLETRHFPAALAAAKKEWESNDLTKGNAFPAAKLSPRVAVHGGRGVPEASRCFRAPQ